jgi:HEAT repeat protein
MKAPVVMTAAALVATALALAQDVPGLTKRLKAGAEAVRLEAAEELAKAGPKAKAALPTLLDVLKTDSSIEVKRAAAKALGAIGPAAKIAVPALVEVLKERDLYTYPTAAEALGNIGPDARPAVPELVPALVHTNRDMREIAEKALAKILPNPKTAAGAYLDSLNNTMNPLARRGGCVAVGRLGVDGRPAVPVLIKLIRDQQDDVKIAAIDALGAIGPAAKEALPNLATASKDDQQNIRVAAEQAMRKIKGEK